MGKPRGRVIDEVVIEVILHVLDAWTGKLTWDLLITAIKASIATEYTRQALSGHERIATAFSLRKASLGKEEGKRSSGDARIDKLLKTIDTLKAKNAHLTIEGEKYRAKFIRWTQNAQKVGLTEEQLDADLTPIHRGASDKNGEVVPFRKAKRAKNGK